MNNGHDIIYIPEEITFGRKVAVIPSVLMDFSHSGNVETLYKDSYVWVDRGSALGNYKLKVDRLDVPVLKWFAGTETQKASIPSPVSGLLLHSIYDFRLSGSSLTAILLPDDEPQAENGEYMFADVCDLCSRNMIYFLKPSRYWTMDAWTREQFEEIVEEQLSLRCEYVDAMPNYKGYLDEIRKRHPSLRPHIKHLA
jgi:hypothetical protein